MPITAPDMKIRLSQELRDKIKSAAAENARTMNTEIAHRLEQSFQSGGGDLERRLSAVEQALLIFRGQGDRLETIEDGLRAICASDDFLRGLNGPARELFQTLLGNLTSN